MENLNNASNQEPTKASDQPTAATINHITLCKIIVWIEMTVGQGKLPP
ncbi:hypothetical protein SAMN04487995_4313 [Dyadobacter koreensis]|uniref:Uncharacterized protein n=1 Tax=Dyadobacter koreensis TaxID=408657 RepID=A0A1H6YC79_9BACT|nr:hypothetical protein SAMN04487995_4313 [Dyadobacter koreensis]